MPASARIFAGDVKVTAQGGRTQGFRAINAQPTAQALSELATALIRGDAFCVSDDPLPEGCKTNAPAFLALTGGSTGTPKVIRRTQASWRASFAVNAQRFDLAKRRSVAVLGTLDHSLALYGVLEGVHAELDVYALGGLGAAWQRRLLGENQIGVIYATPTQLRLLAGNKPKQLAHVEIILCGGGALNRETHALISDLCPNAQLHQFYGAAETSFVTMTDAGTPKGSVGKAYPGVEIILEDDVMWVRSPYLFEGYLRGASAQTRWKDGFVTIGELASIDADGNVWITGRASRLVNVADTLVSPETLERFVEDHPQGGPCAILPQPDPLRSVRLVLVLQGAQNEARAQAVRSACRERFGAMIAPRAVRFIGTLPLLGTGKVDLTALAHWIETQP